MIPDINLLPKIEKGATSLKLAFILVGILSILTIGLLAITYFSAKSEIASAIPERDSLLLTRDTLNAELTTSQTGSQGSLEESVAFVERVSYPVSPIIVETRNLLPTDTYLRSYAFSETGVQVAVDFETLNAISSYVSQLEKVRILVMFKWGQSKTLNLTQLVKKLMIHSNSRKYRDIAWKFSL